MSLRKSAQFKFDSLAGILLMIAFFIGIFYILRGLFLIMLWIAPVLLVAAFIIDRSVVINYGKWLLGLLKSNPLVGIAAILLSLVGYTVVCPFLFAKALLKKKVKEFTKQFDGQQQSELVDYEELESKPTTESRVELPKLEIREAQPRPEKKSEYDQLFD